MESKARENDREREDARPREDEDDATLEPLLRPKPPAKERGRGGTGIGRDLDH